MEPVYNITCRNRRFCQIIFHSYGRALCQPPEQLSPPDMTNQWFTSFGHICTHDHNINQVSNVGYRSELLEQVSSLKSQTAIECVHFEYKTSQWFCLRANFLPHQKALQHWWLNPVEGNIILLQPDAEIHKQINSIKSISSLEIWDNECSITKLQRTNWTPTIWQTWNIICLV